MRHPDEILEDCIDRGLFMPISLTEKSKYKMVRLMGMFVNLPYFLIMVIPFLFIMIFFLTWSLIKDA